MIPIAVSTSTAIRVTRIGLPRPLLLLSRPISSTPHVRSARPDTATGSREDHAHGPTAGAHPSPELSVGRTRSTLRVLVPSVAIMAAFIGWWFFGHTNRAHRKQTVNVGPDAENKLKGSKHRAAQQLASDS